MKCEKCKSDDVIKWFSKTRTAVNAALPGLPGLFADLAFNIKDAVLGKKGFYKCRACGHVFNA